MQCKILAGEGGVHRIEAPPQGAQSDERALGPQQEASTCLMLALLDASLLQDLEGLARAISNAACAQLLLAFSGGGIIGS